MSEMGPVDRYVEAVKLLVPRSKRDAVARELSEELLARIHARGQELGRPLSPDEQAEVLRQHGHPMEVAARYRGRPPIVGPMMLPIYVLTLKLGLGAALVVTAVASVFASSGPDPVQRIAEALLAFPRRALHVLVWTTAAFAALEIAQRRFTLFPGWDPRSLPKVPPPGSRAGAIAGVLFGLAGVVWLLLVPRMPQLLLGRVAAYVEPGPVWRVAYGPVLLVIAASVLVDLADAVWPAWTPRRAYARLAVHTASLVVVLSLLGADALFVASPAAVWPQGVDAPALARAIDAGFRAALAIWAVVAVIEMFRQMIRLKNHRLVLAAGSAAASGRG